MCRSHSLISFRKGPCCVRSCSHCWQLAKQLHTTNNYWTGTKCGCSWYFVHSWENKPFFQLLWLLCSFWKIYQGNFETDMLV